MIVDLRLSKSTSLFIGHGKEFRDKFELYHSEFGTVYVISDEVLLEDANVIRVSSSFEDSYDAIESVKPFLAFISTEDRDLDTKLAYFARRHSKLVYVPDRNDLNDINLCAILQYGPIKIAVSTSGKSPAMTVMVKKRIAASIKKYALIDNMDQSVVEAIARNREKIISSVKEPKKRRIMMYRIAVDRRIREYSVLNPVMADEAIAKILNGAAGR
ncbi:TVG0976073 [Thermoplasma volcanium GSS1]|uniref:precorrin-2 dehydrogenase n=1 Tax=Thermoplasma volcanium (strain ATCC 51530 / DSM 4299 / JCM 9571 / NBRC 15438 / GSS1) TaxID=273116 RepID=Q97A59_THEVO|nr:bifunctional precorrin-2 dehydrogenase/sirohydrochlorin ferrochelatase [Thermoplasma volcanium]BAB60093.1 TVG0976073 [Thermoplasma volcanium GSS1]